MSSAGFAPADGIATAAFLENGLVSRQLEEALTRLSQTWDVRRIKATPEVCEVFKRVRVPALVLYNTAGEETASAVGDLEIVRLVDATLRS
jgi:hypothetical protein